ncbi:hypothetical protein KPTHUN262_53660 [Klebsiella pneumoniae]|uniref:hypothetical protein n=1 Tax=Klebsiella pneumoniae TaxID=573 RepID=UPI0019162CE6|nr:hypothetical protein [Klebsiella pneumoniae]GHS68562.1 hypothetical protein KPTHUN262_51050 [Klebsiella pneumoniae]GHS68823.1 hypothetical protein KPTHUN262_53660 [Klebsiella pneumoniae]
MITHQIIQSEVEELKRILTEKDLMTRENIQRQGAEVKNENAEMEKSHKTKANEFKGDYNERKSKVNSLPGADSPAELEEKAAKTQKDFLDGKR